jgi:hypothetical protein
LAVSGLRNCIILAIYGSRMNNTILAIYVYPETAPFWLILVPENLQIGAVSWARNCQHIAISGSFL